MQSLKTDAVEVYWAKRKAQYKAIESAYKQKELASTAAMEVDNEAIEELKAQRKRKLNEQAEKEKKKQKVVQREEKLEKIQKSNFF